jgi:hypothetical protein
MVSFTHAVQPPMPFPALCCHLLLPGHPQEVQVGTFFLLLLLRSAWRRCARSAGCYETVERLRYHSGWAPAHERCA